MDILAALDELSEDEGEDRDATVAPTAAPNATAAPKPTTTPKAAATPEANLRRTLLKSTPTFTDDASVSSDSEAAGLFGSDVEDIAVSTQPWSHGTSAAHLPSIGSQHTIDLTKSTDKSVDGRHMQHKAAPTEQEQFEEPQLPAGAAPGLGLGDDFFDRFRFEGRGNQAGARASPQSAGAAPASNGSHPACRSLPAGGGGTLMSLLQEKVSQVPSTPNVHRMPVTPLAAMPEARAGACGDARGSECRGDSPLDELLLSCRKGTVHGPMAAAGGTHAQPPQLANLSLIHI